MSAPHPSSVLEELLHGQRTHDLDLTVFMSQRADLRTVSPAVRCGRWPRSCGAFSMVKTLTLTDTARFLTGIAIGAEIAVGRRPYDRR